MLEMEVWVTTETLQYEVEFSPGLESIEQIHDERVSHCLQDLALCSCMGCVFCITHYFCLKTNKKKIEWRGQKNGKTLKKYIKY